MRNLKYVFFLIFSFSVFSQEVTQVKGKSFVMTLGSLKLKEGNEYTFLTSKEDLVAAKVTKIKNGKAILKINDDSVVEKGLTLTLESSAVDANAKSATTDENDNEDEEQENDAEKDNSSMGAVYKTKNHQFGLALGTAKLPKIELLDASGATVIDMNDTTLFGLTISYQYYIREFISIGAAFKNYVGERQIYNYTSSASEKLDSTFSMLDLFVAGHFRDFYLRLGFLPYYAIELEKDDETLELDGSGAEFALGYLHKFKNSSHCMTFEFYGTSGDIDEATVKDGNTTVLSGELIHEVKQKATGINIGWAFQF